MSLFIIDAQIPPSLARFLRDEFSIDASHVQDLGLREARDAVIAAYAEDRAAIIVTKDHDFIRFVEAGRVAGVVLVTCGNVGNRRLREIFSSVWTRVLAALERGSTLVVVHDESSLSEIE